MTTSIPPGSLWCVLTAGGGRPVMSQSLDGIWLTPGPRPPAHFDPREGEHHVRSGTVLLVGETVPRDPASPRGPVGPAGEHSFVRILSPIQGYVSSAYFDPTLRRMERVDGAGETEREEQWHSD